MLRYTALGDILLSARSRHCDFACIIGLPDLYARDVGVFGTMMKTSFFEKRSIGIAALASTRDWAIVSVLIVCVLGLSEAALLWSLMDKHDLRFTLIGVFAGMLPSVLTCLPVQGVVDELSRDALQSFLRSIKFVRYTEQNGTQFYTQNTPTWTRWDSNRVTIMPLPDGQLSVIMPLYCYEMLKRWK